MYKVLPLRAAARSTHERGGARNITLPLNRRSANQPLRRRWICFFMTLQLYPPMSGLVMRARVNCCLIMHSVRRSWQRR